MLHYIKGVVTETGPGMVVLECNGIGYELMVPDNSAAFLSAGTGETITMYTAMLVREDDVSLYGFSDKDSLTMFRMLLTVSGVGGKAAVSILGCMPLNQLVQSISFEDAAAITKAPGVGKKTAQRVVLDLKDKVKVFEHLAAASVAKAPVKSKNKDQAADALVSLGFSRTEAMVALNSVADENLSIEEYIKLALRFKA